MIYRKGTVACGKISTTSQSSKFNAGDYTAKSAGKNGDIEVKVTFDESNTVAIEILSNPETAGGVEDNNWGIVANVTFQLKHQKVKHMSKSLQRHLISFKKLLIKVGLIKLIRSKN